MSSGNDDITIRKQELINLWKNNLYIIRCFCQISLDELSQDTGISKSTLSQFEKDSSRPKMAYYHYVAIRSFLSLGMTSRYPRNSSTYSDISDIYADDFRLKICYLMMVMSNDIFIWSNAEKEFVKNNWNLTFSEYKDKTAKTTYNNISEQNNILLENEQQKLEQRLLEISETTQEQSLQERHFSKLLDESVVTIIDSSVQDGLEQDKEFMTSNGFASNKYLEAIEILNVSPIEKLIQFLAVNAKLLIDTGLIFDNIKARNFALTFLLSKIDKEVVIQEKLHNYYKAEEYKDIYCRLKATENNAYMFMLTQHNPWLWAVSARGNESLSSQKRPRGFLEFVYNLNGCSFERLDFKYHQMHN